MPAGGLAAAQEAVRPPRDHRRGGGPGPRAGGRQGRGGRGADPAGPRRGHPRQGRQGGGGGLRHHAAPAPGNVLFMSICPSSTYDDSSLDQLSPGG